MSSDSPDSVGSSAIAPRRPWVAVVFSLIACGLGQIYCGQVSQGLTLFCLSLIFAPLIKIVGLIPSPGWMLAGVVGSIAAMAAVNLYSIIAAHGAARSGANYRLREFNSPAVYLAMMLVTIASPISVALYIRENLFEAFFIPTSSMSPNFVPGDRVLANKVRAFYQPPGRGEAVIFRNPQDRRQNFIKRVVGLPGDTVELRGGELIVNGRAIERERVPATSLPVGAAPEGAELATETISGRRYLVALGPEADAKRRDLPLVRVPEGMYFLLGDHRDHSLDSREFGCVPAGDLIGYPQVLYWPALSWTRFALARE